MNAFDLVTLICAVGCGLVAGVFFAFSVSVMKALGKLPSSHGIAAMQSINTVILNPLFLAAFLGTTVACLLAMVASFMQPDVPGAWWALGGSVLYLLGVFAVTMRFNVPRNNMLASLEPHSSEATALWRNYLSSWTAWNHVRTTAALAAAISFMMPRWLGT